MRILISCFTNDFEIMKLKWSLAQAGDVLSGEDLKRYSEQTGDLIEYDTATRTITKTVSQARPFGMAIHGTTLFVCDAKLNRIYLYDWRSLESKSYISSPYFNDLHSVIAFKDRLLVTSSGADTLLEIDLDTLDVTPILTFVPDTRAGVIPSQPVAVRKDWSEHAVPTKRQLTHVNFARRLSNSSIQASLFHQGSIVTIDTVSMSMTQTISGLIHPHAFFTIGARTYVANSANHTIDVFLKNGNLEISRRLEGWIQEIRQVKYAMGGSVKTMLAAIEADSSVIHLIDLHKLETLDTITLPKNFRLASMIFGSTDG